MCSDSLRRKNDLSIPLTADCPDPIVADHYQLQAGGRTLVRREVVGDPGGTLENGQVSEAGEERMPGGGTPSHPGSQPGQPQGNPSVVYSSLQ